MDVQRAIDRYDKFINDVLKEDLRSIELQLNYVNKEVADLTQQKHALKIITDKTVHPEGFKTQVNVGCNFFMEASVTDTSMLLINIGLNHFLELSLGEANVYLDARLKGFEEISKELQKRAMNTKAHIKLMLFGIGQLHMQAK